MARKALSALLATLTLTLAAVATTASPAAAASTITCTGSSAITYSPGLTNTPRNVHYDETDQFNPCTSTGVSITSGASSASADFDNATCTAVVPGVFRDPAYVITWSNGSTSTIDLTFTDAIVLGTEQITGVGTVTSGQFVGGAAVIVWIYPVLSPLQCLTSQGVTSQSGTLIAQIIQT